MNCIANNALINERFGANKLCSPFPGSGHVTNCSQLAQKCYKGFVASPLVNTTDVGVQVIYVGSVEAGRAFEDCASGIVETGKFEPGYLSNGGCQLTMNSANGKSSSSSARSDAVPRSKSTIVFTYLAIVLATMSFFSAAAAIPSQSLLHGQPQQIANSSHHEIRKRGVNQCRGFITDKQTQSWSSTVRISATTDCSTSAADCQLALNVNQGAKIESSWVANSANGRAIGFSVTSVFGKAYAESISVAHTDSLPVRVGERGIWSPLRL